jgi:hypothetical protein
MVVVWPKALKLPAPFKLWRSNWDAGQAVESQIEILETRALVLACQLWFNDFATLRILNPGSASMTYGSKKLDNRCSLGSQSIQSEPLPNRLQRRTSILAASRISSYEEKMSLDRSGIRWSSDGDPQLHTYLMSSNICIRSSIFQRTNTYCASQSLMCEP